MKGKRALPIVLALVVLAYFVGAAFFVSVTTLPHIALAISDQKELAVSMAAEYSSGDFDGSGVAKHKKVIIYSADGTMLQYFDPFSSIPYYCEAETNAYLASGKRELAAKPVVVVESAEGDFNDRIDIVAYTAIPLPENDRNAATLVILTDLISDIFFIQNSFLGFNCVFFSFLICGIILYAKQKGINRLRQNYIDNITHELKTPIASIKALTTALNDHDLDTDKRNEYYGIILAEAGRQEHMVQNILELSRIQSKGVSFKKSAVSAHDILAPVCQRYSSLCDDLDLEWAGPDDYSSLPALRTNPDCVRRVMDILLGNALRYTSDGGVIGLSVTESSGHITICVSDTGSGIPADEQKFVFQRFYRGSNSYLKGGNGLGLAIAKEITDGLGEKIWVESNRGQGSKFYFTVRKK